MFTARKMIDSVSPGCSPFSFFRCAWPPAPCAAASSADLAARANHLLLPSDDLVDLPEVFIPKPPPPPPVLLAVDPPEIFIPKPPPPPPPLMA